MRVFRSLPIAAALAGALAFTGPAAPPAAAADLAVTASGGLLYEFDPFTRRGVTLQDNANLEVRFDGCWNSLTRVANNNDYAVSVGVFVEFYTPRGAFVTSVPVVQRTDLDAVGTLAVNERGCDPALGAAFPVLRGYSVRRVFSVR